MNLGKLRQSLILHEGIELKPYKCTADKMTIGVGRNLDDVGITHEEAMTMLDNDLDRCMDDLGRNVPGWRLHSEVRQNVLIEMVFNLGINRFLKFAKMHESLKRYDYNAAANEMLNSKWAKQVGKRAVTMANMMRSGEWHVPN